MTVISAVFHKWWSISPDFTMINTEYPLYVILKTHLLDILDLHVHVELHLVLLSFLAPCLYGWACVVLVLKERLSEWRKENCFLNSSPLSLDNNTYTVKCQSICPMQKNAQVCLSKSCSWLPVFLVLAQSSTQSYVSPRYTNPLYCLTAWNGVLSCRVAYLIDWERADISKTPKQNTAPQNAKLVI